MDRSAAPPHRPGPSDRTLPVDDLPLVPSAEATVVPTDEPPPLPPGKDIHPRRPLPRLREGPAVSDSAPSPPIGGEDR